jgi:hypothetical protein
MQCHIQALYAEFHNAECRYAECSGAQKYYKYIFVPRYEMSLKLVRLESRGCIFSLV